MTLGKGILGFALVLPMLLAACSGADAPVDETIGSQDDALAAAPGCQPAPPGGKCYGHDITAPNGACVAKLDLYAKAEASCQGSKQKLHDFAVLGVCPGGATGAKFLCCDESPPPPPPPPRKCFSGGFQADPAGGACASSQSLSSQVEAICKKQGYLVNTFSAGNACPAGGFDGAKYECCEPKDPPPPPPSTRKCFAGGFANASGPGEPACDSSATLSSKVTSICAAQKYVVNTFAVGAACSGGGFNGASYECCEPKDGPPPPPPPPVCTPAGFAIGQSPGQPPVCSTLAEIEATAKQSCNAGYKNLVPWPCPGGSPGYDGANFLCCNL